MRKKHLRNIAIICFSVVLCTAALFDRACAEDVVYYDSASEAASELRKAMKDRESDVTVGVIKDVDQESLTKLIRTLLKQAVKHTGVPDEGDYINFQYGRYDASARTERVDGGTGVVINYKLSYYDSASQEDALDEKIAEVLESLDLDEKSDYEKVIAIHDWLCDNVEYDSAEGSDLRRTAYDAIVNGTAVCQGYSNALYRMLLEAGVDNRIIFGEGVDNSGDTMAHTWNIVDLYGKYYYIDVTWDDSTGTRDYFLRPAGEFTDSHIPGNEYAANFFTKKYPVSVDEFTFDVGKPNAAVISCAKKMAEALS